jgi:hypothetical protein
VREAGTLAKATAWEAGLLAHSPVTFISSQSAHLGSWDANHTQRRMRLSSFLDGVQHALTVWDNVYPLCVLDLPWSQVHGDPAVLWLPFLSSGTHSWQPPFCAVEGGGRERMLGDAHSH